MSTIPATAYVNAAKALKYHANIMEIPYSPGGHSLLGMDCQGLCEYLLMQCGISYKDCNLAGSNAHYRACVWTGTPEECRARFGGNIPAGVWLFILKKDGGEPDKYKEDGIGNASHMGVYLGNTVAIHASASRGKVTESDFPERTIANGGWNRVGLPKWIVYSNESNIPEDDPVVKVGNNTDRYTAVVATPDGNPVKMRAKPSKRHSLYWKIPNGEMVSVEGKTMQNGMVWAIVRYGSRKGYVMNEFLIGG